MIPAMKARQKRQEVLRAKEETEYIPSDRSLRKRMRRKFYAPSKRYFWIRNFFIWDTATVHKHPANSTANLPLSRVEKNKSATNAITCGRVNPDWRSKSVSSLLLNNKPMDMTAQQQQQSKFCRHYRALYSTCSERLLLQRSPGYYSQSGYHRMRVDRRIRFEYSTCGRVLSKSRRQRQRERNTTKSLIRRTIAVHVPLEFSYTS